MLLIMGINMERLDKILAAQGKFSRNDVKKLIKSGAVKLNGIVVSAPEIKIDYEKDCVELHGKAVDLRKHVYIMLNKPQNVISSSEKSGQATVIDLIPEAMLRKGLFPAGRLDKDTTGFLLITDDGDFAHKILSPKNHIKKTYEAEISEALTEAEINEMREGLALGGNLLLPAKVRLIQSLSPYSRYEIKICEGKYHQIKRMFAHFKKPVISLTRTMMGGLPLDPALAPGKCRYINEDEIKKITL